MQTNPATQILKDRRDQLLSELAAIETAIAQIEGTISSRQDGGVG
jgi:hypothetical protein